MKKLIELLEHKPKLYVTNDERFWDDPYISKSMLKAHINPEYDGATRQEHVVKQSVQWISTSAPVDHYPSLLDLGCGPGIYAELFHEKGYKVTGIDISQRSIEYSRISAKKKGYTIQYDIKDYLKMDVSQTYDMITLIYCDFGTFSKQHRALLLQKIYKMLNSNGCFIFDVFTPSKYEGIQEYKTWKMEQHGFWCEERCVLLHSFYRYDEDHTFLNQYTVIKEQDIKQHHIWEHTFTLDEIKADLMETGFVDISFYNDMTGNKLTDNNHTLCMIAKK